MATLDSLTCRTVQGAPYSYLDGLIRYEYTPTSTNYYLRGIWSLSVNGEQIHITQDDYGKPSSTSQDYNFKGFNQDQLNIIYGGLPNSTTAIIRMTLIAYSDSNYSTQVSVNYKEIRLTIPENVKPKIYSTDINLEPAIVEINGNSYKYLIKGKNNLSLSVSGATGGVGTVIKSYTFKGPSVSKTTTSSSISVPSVTNVDGFVDGRATITYTVTITDGRNRTASADKEIVCYDYHNPYFDAFKASRSGAKLECIYTPVFSPITNIFNDSINRAIVQIYYMTGDTTQIKTVSAQNGEEMSTSIDLDNSSSTYQVYAVITDELNETGRTSTKTMYGDSRVMNVMSDGSGIAFGKKADQSGILESRWPIKANGFLMPEIQHGSIVVPSYATSETVSFEYQFSGTPTVTATSNTTEAIVTNIGVYDINMNGFKIWLTKTNNTSATINWMAVY